jgi:tripartite-type tricarboxylate transporter receptor subunit TctC
VVRRPASARSTPASPIRASRHASPTSPLPLAPEEAAAYVASEIDKWGKVIREAKIKVE